jgi:hypothetical protein
LQCKYKIIFAVTKFLLILQQICYIMSKVGNIGTATFKVGNAIEAIGKTDEMLAVIGVIMIVGVIVSAYGSLWQGNLAKKQYKQECSPNIIPEEKKSMWQTVGLMVLAALVGGLIIWYIFKVKASKDKPVVLQLA